MGEAMPEQVEMRSATEGDEERDGFVSSTNSRASWLNAPFFGQQARRAEVFIGVQFLVVLLLFIVAISAGASGGAGTCAPLSIDWPSVTTDGTFKLPQLRYGLADL